MEVQNVIDQSLVEPAPLAPTSLVTPLMKKLEDYMTSIGGRGEHPMPTTGNVLAKDVRSTWRALNKKVSNLKKAIEKNKSLTMIQLKAFLECTERTAFESAWTTFWDSQDKDEGSPYPSMEDDLQTLREVELEREQQKKIASDTVLARAEGKKLGEEFSKEAMTALRKFATQQQSSEISTQKALLTTAATAEKWIEARNHAEAIVKIYREIQTTTTLNEQAKRNRDGFARRLAPMADAIRQLKPRGTEDKDKENLTKIKNGLLERLKPLNALLSTEGLDPSWEPSVANLKTLVELWAEINQHREGQDDVPPKEPEIRVAHDDKVEKDKRRWSAWADMVKTIDDAFTSGLLEFSRDMQLSGNPGCRFHAQGAYWKFYLDEADMGSNTTMRGWYRAKRVDEDVEVTFVAISDSHGGPTEKVLYGAI